MATVPVTAEYKVQNGRVKKFSGGRISSAPIPNAEQIAVPITDTER